MTRTRFRLAALLLAVVVFSGMCSGQATGIAPASGPQPFGSFGGGPPDTINLGNLNVHFAIPVLHKAGRGLPFNYDLKYDSSVWYPVGSSGSQVWTPVSTWGWRGWTESSLGYVTYSQSTTKCFNDTGQWSWGSRDNNFVYHDPWGASHWFPISLMCGDGTNTASASDGSGYSATFPNSITTRTGGQLTVPQNVATGSGLRKDSNGNEITVSAAGVFTDTLGTTALTVSGSNPVLFTYTNPQNVSVSAKINYTSYTVKTNFGVSGISEYGPLSNSLVSSITLPDSTSYSFVYEATTGSCTPLSGTYSANCITGRIHSITLPTGGTITYVYSGGPNNTGIESDGSTAGMTRTLNPGGQWTYSRTAVSGTHWTTTVTDPSTPTGNQTVFDFVEDSSTTSNSFYETRRVVYQGTAPTTPLQTQITCYNAPAGAVVPTNCPSGAVTSPMTRKTVFKYLPDATGKQSEVDLTYNAVSLVTKADEYDFASGLGVVGALIREILTTYGVNNHPTSVVTKDGSGNVLSQANYTYDEGTPTATTGTPQHVAAGTGRGNLTTVATKVNSTQTLYRKFTYYDTGTPSSATDSSLSATTNGPATTYVYGTGSCGNSFPTQVNGPLSLSRSMTYDPNCMGGVQTALTDENLQQTQTNYGDANYWRPTSVVDQISNNTAINYVLPGSGGPAAETTLNFNGTISVSDSRVTVDKFGRPILGQRLQGPGSSNYDTVETDYDNLGRVSRVTMPFQATAGTTSSTAPSKVTTVYDAMGRPQTITDGGGGTAQYTYSYNDTLQKIGPTQTFQKQFEYDGLGRLTSVCEITSTLPGNGSCGQQNSQTGYWTKYTYDAMGDLTNVVQNAQASSGMQTRTFVYDMLGRATSETNPETGQVQYFYDSLSNDSACGTVSYPGNLVKKIDGVGNAVCYAYDLLHRMTSVTYPSGAYSSSTPTKTFVYDAAAINGFTLNNTKGRMAEAYTCTGTCASKITDEIFSYSARGEMTDVYELTPHSGTNTYYHTTAAYWAHGALKSLSGIPTVPTVYYGASDGTGLDGEGRVTKVNASSGTNPITGVTYTTSGTSEPIGSLTKVTFGSSDFDSFTYDTQTGRMKTYIFNVNGQTDTGTLAWNKNGTLNQLAIVDQLNSSDTQTCGYTYDDLQRVTTSACNAVWSQTFSYDVFGNITKSGSSAFTPGYSSSTNRFTSLPGITPTYDGNGNLTTDNLNTYTWDADNHPLTVTTSGTTVSVTYDALGRMVEKGSGSTFTGFIYAPNGEKVASVIGQTLVKAFVRLPGGAKAVYNSSGILYYRHSDWLGSSRLASTPARAMYSSSAYAPFGEQYAKAGATDASFTDQEQDTVSNLYDFPARRYSPSQGRWISPDPAGRAAVSLTNPQSWNRYVYVLNNPLRLVDPAGLCDKSDSGGDDDDDDDKGCGGGSGGGDDSGGGGGDDSGGGGDSGGDDSGSGCDPTTDPTCVSMPGDTCDTDLTACPLNLPVQNAADCPPGSNLDPNSQPMVGPGTAFDSPLQAGAAAVAGVNQASQSVGSEYVGLIYQLPSGSFSFTTPVEGSAKGAGGGGTDIPFGAQTVGVYHTHTGGQANTFPEVFSYGDALAATEAANEPNGVGAGGSGINVLGTPSGNTLAFIGTSPEGGSVIELSGPGCLSGD